MLGGSPALAFEKVELSAEALEPAGVAANVAPVASPSRAGDDSSREACRFRDPEDGTCYATADEADAAWLARATTHPARHAKAPVHLVAKATDDVDEEVDEDEAEAEDGGFLAPVDPLVPRGRRLPPLSDLQKPQSSSLLKQLAAKLTNLVVRKSDSRPVSISEGEVEALFTTGFPLPIEQFSWSKFRDSFNSPRGRHRRHHAIDLPAPRGTPVVAVVDGIVERLGRDRKGGKVCYLRDLSGRFIFYYAHLAKHAEGLRVGDRVNRGQQLGEVGSTGHVIGGPHLHFAIFRESEEESTWKRGFVVNPYLVFSTLGLR